MRPLPLSLWLLVAAQIEAREQARADAHHQPLVLPTAIRKMPADRGAKFHHEYCAFGDHTTFAPASSRPHAATAAAIAARSLHDADDARRLWANASAELSLRPPFALLSEPETPEKDESIAPAWSLFRRAASALALLEKRQWACPSGTSSCSSIGFPNSCCGQDETCVEVPDTGLGPVGCCPSGATCNGGISDCAGGSTACGSSLGGGCCIPGFVCMGVGCVRYSSSSPPPAATPTTLTTTSTRIVSDPTRSTILVTVTTTVTPSGPPVTSTVIETTTASSARSGGGAGAPFRPTSSPQPSGSSTRTTGTGAYCPTGFYPCLARAGGGCCQTGRECAVTSCPPPPQQSEMTTVVDGNGVTVVVPADDAAAAAAAAATATTATTATTAADGCAAGWFLCGRDAGPDAGCCPSGYECGTASCFREGAGATGASVAKELPGQSGSAGEARATAGWGLVVGIGMLWGVGFVGLRL